MGSSPAHARISSDCLNANDGPQARQSSGTQGKTIVAPTGQDNPDASSAQYEPIGRKSLGDPDGKNALLAPDDDNGAKSSLPPSQLRQLARQTELGQEMTSSAGFQYPKGLNAQESDRSSEE